VKKHGKKDYNKGMGVVELEEREARYLIKYGGLYVNPFDPALSVQKLKPIYYTHLHSLHAI